MTRRYIAGVLFTLACAMGLVVMRQRFRPPRLRVTEGESVLPADGRFHNLGSLESQRALKPDGVSVDGLPAHASARAGGRVALEVQSPVLPGERLLHIGYGRASTALRIRFVPSFQDNVGNGTPDFLRLHTAGDRNAFRGWFLSLAEAAADMPPEKLPHEIDDCAALLRWCYRNSLHAHDETWVSKAPAMLDLTQPSVRQFVYPLTPLGAGLFRVRAGAFSVRDMNNGAFAEFADAQTLWRLNTFFLSRSVRSARPGDLLFFRQLEQNSPYHSMIVTTAGQKSVIYHTGPIGRGSGEVRRVLLQELLTHPDPRWRPVAENSNFLGVYRWNILEEDPR